MELIDKALIKARKLHKEQFRKGGKVPYFVHLIDVGKILMYEEDLNENVICAGILHDTLEDTKYTREDLKRDFGEEVYNIVDFCSEPGNTPTTTEEEGKKNWKNRKTHSINSLKNATEEQLLVFIADKYSNLSSMKEDLILIGDELWKKFNAPYEEIKWYFVSIRDESRKKIPNKRTFILFDKLVKEVFK